MQFNFEFPYWSNLIKDKFDRYHEHVSYFTVKYLKSFYKKKTSLLISGNRISWAL